VEFRLIYEGKLPSQSSAGTNDKHEIRKKLHPQLKEAWDQFPFLDRNIAYFRDQFRAYGFSFVPLVVSRQKAVHWAHQCTLDILFLRRGAPGNSLTSVEMKANSEGVICAFPRRNPQRR